MHLAHLIQLEPTAAQEEYFRRACGCRRYAYNWALHKYKEGLDAGSKPKLFNLKKEFNAFKKEIPWAYEVTKCAMEHAFVDLQKAFSNFFGKRARFPKFKKKGIGDSFYLSNDKFSLNQRRLNVPKLGPVKMRETLRFEGRILSATIKRIADRWYVSVLVDTQVWPLESKSHAHVGVDLGLHRFCQLSTGESDFFVAPKPLKALLKKLGRLQRQLSRKQKGSSNRWKARMKVARLHRRIANIRDDFLHKLTTFIAKTFENVGIEDLNVRGMLANGRLSRALSDVSFSRFRRMLTYKMAMYGGQLLVYPRFMPSTKACSNCGSVVASMPLSVRTFTCPDCGHTCDRDYNASKVIEQFVISTVGSTGSHACGEDGLCVPA